LPVLLSFQSWKKYNKWQKFSKWPYVTLPNNYKKYRMAVKYTKKLLLQSFQNIQKLGGWVWKYTIWHPCWQRWRPQKCFMWQLTRGGYIHTPKQLSCLQSFFSSVTKKWPKVSKSKRPRFSCHFGFVEFRYMYM
jgi:hypothetical protein